MDKAPITARIHLIGGQTIELPCETFEIVPASVDEQGNETPLALNYTPFGGWGSGVRALEWMNFGAMVAVDVDRPAATDAQDDG